jgi:hypothetical protein
MPHLYASQFRAMVIEQVRNGRRVADVAASVEVPAVRTESSQVGWSPSPPEAPTVSAKRQVLGTHLRAPAYVGSQDVSDVAGKAPAEEDPCEKNGERGNDIDGAAGEIQD